jgi:hypothetical protein
MQCRSKYFLIFKTIVCLSLAALLAGYPTSGWSEPKFEKIVESYLEAAFVKTRENLVRPSGAAPISVVFSCRKDSCSDKIRTLSKHLSPLNFTLKADTASSLVEIELYEQKTNFQKEFVTRYLGSGLKLFVLGEETCRLLVILNGAQVEKIGLAVSSGLNDKKASACIASQLFVGLGLSLPMNLNFEELWSSPDFAIENYTEREFNQLFQGLQAVLKLHMCVELKPSATKLEVTDMLSKSQKCFEQM